MSLQVWLPLNKDINGRGLCNVPTTSINSASIATGGKLGGCLSLSSDGQAVSLDSYMDVCSTYTRYSMSAWIYMSSTATNHSSSILSSGDWNSDSGQFCFALYKYSSDGYYKILVPNRSSWSDGINLSSPIKLNTWYNICVTYDGNSTRGYLNGEYVGSYAGGGITDSSESKNLYVGSATYYNGFTLKGSINDVRIYNHCLSAKEVKEISKGLICHYKLDNRGFGNPNILITQNPSDFGRQGNIYTSTASDSRTNDPFQLQYFKGSTYVSTFYTQGVSVTPCDVKTTFTVPESITGVRVKFNGTSNDIDLFGASQAPVTAGETYTLSLRILSSKSEIVGGIQVENPKLEKGSVATSWCPHTSDSLYTSLGLNSTTESDCSGLSNNGTKIGGLSSSTNPLSIRYESCYDFDGNTGSIQIPNLATLVPSGEFTMNCWIYHDDTWSSKTYETIFGGPSGFELEAKKSSTNSPFLYAYNWGQGEAAYELNKWNMITMTRNASEAKFYINGELKITGSAGTIPSGDYFIGAWRTSSEQNYKGKISDFRLYSTVLSVEDIKELYNTSASIDKNGNMYAYEFKEE